MPGLRKLWCLVPWCPGSSCLAAGLEAKRRRGRGGRSSDQGRGSKAPLWVGPGTDAGVRGGQWQPYNPRAHRCWGMSPLEEWGPIQPEGRGGSAEALASWAELHSQAGQGRHLVAEAVCRATHSSHARVDGTLLVGLFPLQSHRTIRCPRSP